MANLGKLTLKPDCGAKLVRFVGDALRFELIPDLPPPADGEHRAFLRTHLGNAAALREFTIQTFEDRKLIAFNPWRDVEMIWQEDRWVVTVALAETGFFESKAYVMDHKLWQSWPDGSNICVAVHPDCTRTANTIYCAFPRMFGPNAPLASTEPPPESKEVEVLDGLGYATLPASGKLRDVTRRLPHIVQTLGCRILHLLPVTPTPTTYARMGRFGSPYATGDLTTIDPALIEFDKKTTGAEQFVELTHAAHALGARVILDIVLNHTGWSSRLHEEHPEWFLRKSDGTFISPGAWGTTWEDLVELDHHSHELCRALADSLIVWCERGVDGFRCDAGYKLPVQVWAYVVARVRQFYPDAIFLLEGLGGAWEATENLLAAGGMNWAYSELFQNFDPGYVSGYLDHAIEQTKRCGLLVHYSETHDNDRLAAKGKRWSLLRNGLSALTSPNGGFGFTCGVEWLAAEKVKVHASRGMAWGAKDNIVTELGKLNRLLSDHPCFFDGAALKRISKPGNPVLAMLRVSADETEEVLIVINLDPTHKHCFDCREAWFEAVPATELYGDGELKHSIDAKSPAVIQLKPGAVYCLSELPLEPGHGEVYRQKRAAFAWATQMAAQLHGAECVHLEPWEPVADWVIENPGAFLGALHQIPTGKTVTLERAQRYSEHYHAVVRWNANDIWRCVLVPQGHYLLIEDPAPFRVCLRDLAGRTLAIACSWKGSSAHYASFLGAGWPEDVTVELQKHGPALRKLKGFLRITPSQPLAAVSSIVLQRADLRSPKAFGLARELNAPKVLLTNGRGAMSRFAINLGQITSKYDCVLGANLHPDVPVDRHVLVKRLRAWIQIEGFGIALDEDCLASFAWDGTATWEFDVPSTSGARVRLQMKARMVENENTVKFQWTRLNSDAATDALRARLSFRVDIEDRSFHGETSRNGASEHHFRSNVRELMDEVGFAFEPDAARKLYAYADRGVFHLTEEWSTGIWHPVEGSRGQVSSSDAFSPGWFDCSLEAGQSQVLVLSAEPFVQQSRLAAIDSEFSVEAATPFETQLVRAARQFVVRRGTGKTVIAGYPWFLDWGRDTLISARGLLAAGMANEVWGIVKVFAAFEERGTLPNSIFGENASNRDTSDAALWFVVVCGELFEMVGPEEAERRLNTPVDKAGRTLRAILISIAHHYSQGTPNRIHLDQASGLIWSPSHFTWMDTNYPAATPREGYPICIQALWIRTLQLVAGIDNSAHPRDWLALAAQAQASLNSLYWIGSEGYYADNLAAAYGIPATQAQLDDSLRNNQLFALNFGLFPADRARRVLEAVSRYLLIPGALRSLAPKSVIRTAPVYGNDGALLNDPHNPYWGRYEGDEDTRRKPAYHNGTGWTWTFPGYCEAIARVFPKDALALAAAKSFLLSSERCLRLTCIGQIPEVVDGDFPHQERGCDAQAWGVTEALRVWKLLETLTP